MADYFVDTDLATGANDGTTTDDAWQSLETALAYASFVAGDKIHVRRRSSLDGASGAITLNVPTSFGDEAIECRCWGRPDQGFTAALVQGSNTITNLSIQASQLTHAGRMMYVDDVGLTDEFYMITKAVPEVIDALVNVTGVVLSLPIGVDGAYDLVFTAVGQTLSWGGGTPVAVGAGGDFNLEDGGGNSITATVTPVGLPVGDASDLAVGVVKGYFLIDRPYVSGSESNNCVVCEDPWYDEDQLIDDSAWVIKKADYNADGLDRPYLDFQTDDYYIAVPTTAFWHFKGMAFKNGTAKMFACATIYNRIAFLQCYFEQYDGGDAVLNISSTFGLCLYFEQCVFKGPGAASAAACEVFKSTSLLGGAYIKFKRFAIYGFKGGSYGIWAGNSHYIEADYGNFGVEEDNAVGVPIGGGVPLHWTDVQINALSGLRVKCLSYLASLCIENYGKLLNVSYKINSYGTSNPLSVGPATDPVQRNGGADVVVDSQQYFGEAMPPLLDQKGVSQHLFGENGLLVWAAASESKTYKVYVQSKGKSVLATELYLEAEYIGASDTGGHIPYITRSAEAVTERATSSDWSQYLSVTVTPAVAGWVKLKLYSNYYGALASSALVNVTGVVLSNLSGSVVGAYDLGYIAPTIGALTNVTGVVLSWPVGGDGGYDLVYTAVGTLLSWGGGAGVDVSGGGAFTLDDGSGNTITATVTPGSLPVGNASDLAVAVTCATLSWDGGTPVNVSVAGSGQLYDTGENVVTYTIADVGNLPGTDETDEVTISMDKELFIDPKVEIS